MKKQISALALLCGAGLAWAHEGHGLAGTSHWHTSDVLLVLGAVGALGLWLARGK